MNVLRRTTTRLPPRLLCATPAPRVTTTTRRITPCSRKTPLLTMNMASIRRHPTRQNQNTFCSPVPEKANTTSSTLRYSHSRCSCRRGTLPRALFPLRSSPPLNRVSWERAAAACWIRPEATRGSTASLVRRVGSMTPIPVVRPSRRCTLRGTRAMKTLPSCTKSGRTRMTRKPSGRMT